MAKRKGRKLSPAARRAYLAGVRRGKVLFASALTRKRKAAARQAAETRKQKPKKPKAAPEAVSVGALTFFDSETEGFAILSGIPLAQHMQAADWVATVEMRNVKTGTVLIETTLQFTIAPMWDDEEVQATLRREVRAWDEGVRAEHPQWFAGGDSPTVDLFRLILRLRD